MNDQFQQTWDILTYGQERPKVRWFCRRLNGDNLGGIVTNPVDLANIARLSHQGYNCYVTLNPTNERACKRINTDDVTKWGFIFLDFDPLDVENQTPMPDFIAAVRQVFSVIDPDLKPAIINSGRGVQMWVRLPEYPCDSPTERAQCAAVNRGFLLRFRDVVTPLGWRLDMLSDLARIARLPGSMNQRNGAFAAILDPGTVAPTVTLDWLIQNFYRPLPISSPVTNYSQDATWEQVKDDLPFRAQRFLTYGATAGERHETCFHVCKSLHERGVTEESALEALCWGNEACKEPLQMFELREILNQVYGRNR